jgi:hypothetical protein
VPAQVATLGWCNRAEGVLTMGCLGRACGAEPVLTSGGRTSIAVGFE